MDPAAVKKALAELCEDLDAGRRMRRPTFALPAAIMAGMGVTLWSGCDQAVALYAARDTGDDTADTAVPETETHCTDDLDDDADGLVDCDDDDCDGDPACASDLYRAP